MMADFSTNMNIYERCRSVPAEAQKQFNNGRFSGTDINPMWRIKKLTELFGPSGIGWWTEDVKYWLEQGSDGTVAAFCSLSLRYVLGDKTSQPVHGIGGNVFIQKNRTSDEAFKMAYTDALDTFTTAQETEVAARIDLLTAYNTYQWAKRGVITATT